MAPGARGAQPTSRAEAVLDRALNASASDVASSGRFLFRVALALESDATALTTAAAAPGLAPDEMADSGAQVALRTGRR